MLVSKDAAKEAKAEQLLGTVLDQSSHLDTRGGILPPLGLGRGAVRQLGEEVFLAQLHRRAVLLNDGFQTRILKILSRYSTVASVESKSSEKDSNVDFTGPSAPSLFSRASTMSEHSRSKNTDSAVLLFDCIFADGVGTVEVHQAPVKTWVETRNI